MTIVAGIVQVLGAALLVLAAVGLLRLPDAVTRASAVSKAAVLGVVLILLGALADRPDLRTSVLVVAIIAVHVLTVPLSGLAIGTAAYRVGAASPPFTRLDEPAEQAAGRDQHPDGSDPARPADGDASVT